MNISKEQIKRIYSLGAACGLLEPGNKHDNLHAFVWSLTQKLSIRELTDAEAKRVLKHLGDNLCALKMQERPVQAWISEQQISLAFRYIYRLQELAPSAAAPKQRLAGAMVKALGIPRPDITKDIFKGITEAQGAALIEMLKRYVTNAERKAARAAAKGE